MLLRGNIEQLAAFSLEPELKLGPQMPVVLSLRNAVQERSLARSEN